jgi:iron complex transport system permease protein
MNVVLSPTGAPLAPEPIRAPARSKRAPRLRPAELRWLVVLSVLLAGALLHAASSGAYPIRPGEILSLLAEWIGIGSFDGPPAHRGVFFSIRLPRVATAAVLGATLGLAGTSLQAIFRNPLADPGLIGVSAGAATGAAIAIVLIPASFIVPPLVLLPLAAFAGGLLATGLATTLALRGGQLDVATLLLAGIAVNAFAGGFVGLLTYVADDTRLRTLTLWSMGSASGTTPSIVLVMAAATIPLALFAFAHHRSWDALQLGPASAWALGVDVARVERRTVILAALAVAATVSFTGIVSFVGLVAPHLARLLAGGRHRSIAALSAVGGALLVVVADTAARTIAAPAELPLGVLLSFVGAPALVLLLRRNRGRHA